MVEGAPEATNPFSTIIGALLAMLLAPTALSYAASGRSPRDHHQRSDLQTSGLSRVPPHSSSCHLVAAEDVQHRHRVRRCRDRGQGGLNQKGSHQPELLRSRSRAVRVFTSICFLDSSHPQIHLPVSLDTNILHLRTNRTKFCQRRWID